MCEKASFGDVGNLRLHKNVSSDSDVSTAAALGASTCCAKTCTQSFRPAHLEMQLKNLKVSMEKYTQDEKNQSLVSMLRSCPRDP